MKKTNEIYTSLYLFSGFYGKLIAFVVFYSFQFSFSQINISKGAILFIGGKSTLHIDSSAFNNEVKNEGLILLGNIKDAHSKPTKQTNIRCKTYDQLTKNTSKKLARKTNDKLEHHEQKKVVLLIAIPQSSAVFSLNGKYYAPAITPSIDHLSIITKNSTHNFCKIQSESIDLPFNQVAIYLYVDSKAHSIRPPPRLFS